MDLLKTTQSKCWSMKAIDKFCNDGKNKMVAGSMNDGYISGQWKETSNAIGPEVEPREVVLEAISRQSRVERDRCIELVWENREIFTSNIDCLRLMSILNGNT